MYACFKFYFIHLKGKEENENILNPLWVSLHFKFSVYSGFKSLNNDLQSCQAIFDMLKKYCMTVDDSFILTVLLVCWAEDSVVEIALDPKTRDLGPGPGSR